MPFIWDWIWEKLSGVSKTSTQPQSVDQARVDDQVGKKVVRHRRKVPAKKSNPSTKPRRVCSDNKGKTARKSPGKAVCATASKNKAKGKVVPKG